jgi:uncharacterized protein (TIGR02301 family)
LAQFGSANHLRSKGEGILPMLTDSLSALLSQRRTAVGRRLAPIVPKLILVAAAAILTSPAAAQNLLERSRAAPAYEEPEQSPPAFTPPRESRPPAPHSAVLPLPGAVPAPGQPAKPGTAPAAEEPAPPYEPQLLRLSELLGALTYLQNLCGGQSGQVWRDKMTALMDAETQDETRRERLAGAYNRGFKGYELNYRQCTANAQAIITRFLNESGRIARDVTRRYGTS